ncbi:hypothetical protein B0A48_12852 [Cryoendolithus antarcticus]|uniref:FAD-binding domain-containing protein n=1 Tax=Cryoendolithus antarcticus TaxID=1507870 RepID=A0A1V8SQD7_9PEZI|nr:hypothetical protein B0A48_12852 [Cryoendolithus antarcticus]
MAANGIINGTPALRKAKGESEKIIDYLIVGTGPAGGSMAGEEYARIFSWGNSPRRKGDYELASPSEPLDLPQTLLEPLLTRYASQNGFHCRFSTELVSFDQVSEHGGVRCTLRDLVSDHTYTIRCKHLFGADGGRSRIAKSLGLPFTEKPGGGFAINLLIEADMSHIIDDRKGNLHWLLQPDREAPDFAWIGCIRMVKPWHEWLCIIFPKPGAERKARPAEDYVDRVRELIGDDSIEFKIKGVSTWQINETSANVYSKGSVFCLGDAVHRHPPNHGLGSNTCIQDAHNLAWKVAYVNCGWAGRGLLDTYNAERQPVGQNVVFQANASLRNHIEIWRLLGNFEANPSDGAAALRELREDSPAGFQRRSQFQAALKLIDREEHGLGVEMNQRYTSTAIYTADEPAPRPAFTRDPVEHYQPSTYPGARLPHAWLSNVVPSKAISTLDLAGKGRFTLLTGIGGDGWLAAAKQVSAELGVPLEAFSIGYGKQWADRYLEWEKLREVEETGCVLVRPDYFVAWRCQKWEMDGVKRLGRAMRSVLSR